MRAPHIPSPYGTWFPERAHKGAGSCRYPAHFISFQSRSILSDVIRPTSTHHKPTQCNSIALDSICMTFQFDWIAFDLTLLCLMEIYPFGFELTHLYSIQFNSAQLDALRYNSSQSNKTRLNSISLNSIQMPQCTRIVL